MASASIAESMSRLVSRARVVLVSQRTAVIVTWVIWTVITLAVLDYLLHVPGWLRGVTLPAWLGALGLVVWRWVGPAWRFEPALTDVALRVERAVPEVSGSLASAVDLGAGRGALPTGNSRAMAEAVVRQAAQAWGGRDAATLIRTDTLRRRCGWLLLAVSVTIGLGVSAPMLSLIGLQRVLTPWSGAAWPKRTEIADATSQKVHALGESLPLRAVLARSPGLPEQTDIFAEYRFITAGVPGPSRRELLTWQNRPAETAVESTDALGRTVGTRVSGQLFERLIEPVGDAVEYRLSTSDDETAWRTLRLVPPPALAEARAVVTPPGYAGGEAVHVEMGNGTDERGVAPPSLRGSRVELTLKLNKPAEFDPPLLEQLRATDPAGTGLGAVLSGGDTEWKLSWTLGESVRLVVRAVDENAIASVDEAALRFDSTADKPPEATITQPGSDRGVLATALIDVTAEGRDDVGLKWLVLQRQIAKPAGREGGEKSPAGGAVEPVGEPESIAREEPKEAARQITLRSGVDLSVLGVRAGDEIRLTALAKDVFVGSGPGDERPATRSPVRTLRVISEAQFIEEVRRELGMVRQSAIRIDAQQGEVQARTGERGADRQARRGQAQVSERVSRQAEAVKNVVSRVQENGLVDPALADLLRQSADSLQEAGRSSSQAGRTLDDAAAGAPEPGPDEKDPQPVGAEKAKEAQPEQQKVRDQMQRLAELLDRGQDNWVVKNKLSQMVKSQRELRDRSRQLGSKTAGKQTSDLTEQEQSELEAIVEKQMQLSEQLNKLTKDMREKADELDKTDAGASKGMRDAAQRAEQQQVSESMKSAASKARQNQMNDASQRQEQAAKAMDQMLDDMNDADKQRAMILKRKLQELTEAIERLVRRQTAELAALDGAQQAQNGYAGLDKGMIQLNQNTLGVSDQARTMRDLEPVAKLLGKAGDAQSSAVKGLRSDKVEPDPVRRDENESLDALKTALERVKDLQKKLDDQEQAKKLADLKAKYKEMLDKQAAIRAETDGFSRMKELTRRDRVLVRKLAEGQGQIRDALNELREGSKDLKEAVVFDFAHKRLDALTGNAAKALDGAEPVAALPPEDGVIATLRGVLDALTDPKDDSKFSQGAGSGSGSGGSGKKKMIPPGKQLRLLRTMQAEAARLTTAADKDGANLLPEATQLQREISDVADTLMKKLQPGGGGDDDKPEIPFGPAPKPGDETAPKPGDKQPPDPPGAGEPKPGPERAGTHPTSWRRRAA